METEHQKGYVLGVVGVGSVGRTSIHSAEANIVIVDTGSVGIPGVYKTETDIIRVGDDYYRINGNTPLLDRKMAKPILQEVELIMKKESNLSRKSRDKTMEFFYRNFDKVEKEESQ